MEDKELLVSKMERALDIKTKLFGFELPDLLLIFMNLSFTNLLFSTISIRYFIVWGTTLLIALFLFFVKRGKPDAYLQHYGEFIIQSSHKSAGKGDVLYRRFIRENHENKKQQ